jgi:hypothetical protein
MALGDAAAATEQSQSSVRNACRIRLLFETRPFHPVQRFSVRLVSGSISRL